MSLVVDRNPDDASFKDSALDEKTLPPRNSTDHPLALFNYLDKVQSSPDDILQYHQKVVHRFFTELPDHRGLLVHHGTGTGKTMLAVSIADVMKATRRVIVLSAKSLQHNFVKEVRKYMGLKGERDIDAVLTRDYKFISSNAGNMLAQLGRLGKSPDELAFEKALDVTAAIDLEGALLIVDEAQNFFNGIVNGSRNATGLYRAIMAATDIKLCFLSATPIINDPFEIVPMFNMLHGGELLPEDYDDFYNLYVDTVHLRVKNREKFKNRIFGLVSYMGDWWKTGGVLQPGATVKRDHFPDQLATIVERVPMSEEQFSAYSHARDIESTVTQARVTVKTTLQKPKTDPGSTYRVASRQISNFLLPDTAWVKKVDSHGFSKHVDRLTADHLADLDVRSPKMKRILANVLANPGLSVVYSSFVTGEGLRIFSMVLEARGWRAYDRAKPKRSTERVFATVSGEVSADDRAYILAEFNKRTNRDGEEIDMLLLSGAGAEGLDLKNVMSIHVMEPYWNFGRIEQIIARAVRFRSHDDYPPEERVVQPYIYLSDYPKNFQHKPTKAKPEPEMTTDVHLYTKSVKGKLLIDRFYAAQIEASIDCSVHVKGAPESVREKIHCVMCTPTGDKLFHPSNDVDLKTKNPCVPISKESVFAEQIVYQGVTYYYTKTPDGAFSVYQFKPDLDAYIEMARDHPHYTAIIDQLGA